MYTLFVNRQHWLSMMFMHRMSSEILKGQYLYADYCQLKMLMLLEKDILALWTFTVFTFVYCILSLSHQKGDFRQSFRQSFFTKSNFALSVQIYICNFIQCTMYTPYNVYFNSYCKNVTYDCDLPVCYIKLSFFKLNVQRHS